MTRRAVLKAGGFASLVAVLNGSPMFRLTPVASADPTLSPFNPPSIAKSPLTVQASCELSEDAYQVDQVSVAKGDQTLPYTTPDGTNEAVVFSPSANTISHLQRDLTKTSGWTYRSFFGNAAAAAIATPYRGGPCLAAVSVYDGLLFFNYDSSQGGWVVSDNAQIPLDQTPDVLTGGVTSEGLGYFVYSVAGVWSLYRLDDGSIHPLNGIDPTYTEVNINWNTGGGSVTALRSDGAVLQWWNTDPNDPYTFDPSTIHDMRPDPTVVATELTFTTFDLGEDPTHPGPNYLTAGFYRSGDQLCLIGVGTGSSNIDTGKLGGIADGADQWFAQVTTADAATATTTLALFWIRPDNTLCTATITAPPSAEPQIGQPLPLHPDVHSVGAAPSAATNTLFLVDKDTAAVETLTVDPISNLWSTSPVYADNGGDHFSSVTMWRMLITVVDPNGVPVPKAPVQLIADQMVEGWQATGQLALSNQPTSLQTDWSGRISLAIPSVELDTAGLTARTPSGLPVALTPDYDMQQFFAGNSSLPDIGPLTSDALLDPSCPASNYLQSAGSQVAAQYAQTMTQLTSLGLDPSDTSLPPISMDLTGAAQRNGTLSSAQRRRLQNGKLLGSLGSFESDARSVWHAVRHGAIAVDNFATSVVDDGKNWIISAATDVANSAPFQWVVNGVKDALHLVHALFNKLEVGLHDALNWCKHHMFAALQRAAKGASYLYGLLGQAETNIEDCINKLDVMADGYFAKKQGDLDTAIAAVVQQIDPNDPTNQLGAGDTGTGSTNTGSDLIELVKDLGKITDALSYVSPTYWIDKLKAHFGLPIPQAPEPDTDTATLMSNLVETVYGSMDLAESVSKLMGQTFQDVFSSKGSISAHDMGAWLTDVGSVGDKALELADDLVHDVTAALDIGVKAFASILDQDIDSKAVSDLYDLTGITDPNRAKVGFLIGLAFALPASLLVDAYNQKNKTSLTLIPTDTQFARAQLARGQAKRHGHAGSSHPQLGTTADDPWGFSMNIVCLGVMMIWTAGGLLEDTQDYGANKGNVPQWCWWIDILAPLAITLCQWPHDPADTVTPEPLTAPLPTSVGHAGGTVIPTLVASVIPAIFTALGVHFAPPKVSNDPTKTDYWNSNVTPITSMLTGTITIVLSSVWNWANHQSKASKVVGIAGGLSYFVAPLGIPEVNDLLGGWGAPAAAVVDVAANAITSFGFAFEES